MNTTVIVIEDDNKTNFEIELTHAIQGLNKDSYQIHYSPVYSKCIRTALGKEIGGIVHSALIVFN